MYCSYSCSLILVKDRNLKVDSMSKNGQGLPWRGPLIDWSMDCVEFNLSNKREKRGLVEKGKTKE